jgi:hypothetical protein
MAGTVVLAPTVCATFGMAMSLLLLLLLRRQTDRQAEWAAGVLLGAFVFAMYASAMVLPGAAFVGLARQSWQALLSIHISLSFAAFIPSIVLLGWKRSSIFKDGSPVGNALFRSSLAGASLTAGLLWFGPPVLVAEKRITQIVVFNGLFFLSVGFHRLLKHKLSAQLRLCMVITRAFYAVGLILALLTHPEMEAPSLAYAALDLTQQLCIQVGILGSFIFIAQFRFADVFVKWSVRMAGLSLLAIALPPHLLEHSAICKLSDQFFINSDGKRCRNTINALCENRDPNRRLPLGVVAGSLQSISIGHLDRKRS